MSRAEILSRVAKKFPFVFREIATQSIRGFLPPIHKHWWFRAQAADLFGDSGFPMRYGSCRLYIPPELHSVYLNYFDMWDHEPLTSRVFTKTLRSGDVVVDVGANIGYFTLLSASMVGPKGRVHAVECSPDTLAVLKNNIQKNHLHNVEVYPVAASNERGTLNLNVTAIGLSWLVPHDKWPGSKASPRTVSVPAVPLDEIIQSPVHFVKIDAEGADLDVLKGMKRILTENPRISVIVEWAPPLLAAAGQDPLELPRWLQEAGFRNICVLDEQLQRQRSFEECIEMARAGKFPRDWVGDFFAQKDGAS
jgi:FkbM family methyltransferase